MRYIPYCGAPPVPAELFGRFNFDPVLLTVLLALAAAQFRAVPSARRPAAAIGWLVAVAAFVSPLCALSVALFAARVGQHMLLVLVAAPLIGWSLAGTARGRLLWPATALFILALWFWHLPGPYDATYRSTALYWSMHVSLFGSAVLFWREVLARNRTRSASQIVAGTAASMAMAMLGAMLTLASWPMFAWHYTTTLAWGITPIADQQLGGTLMWVPGGVLFTWFAMRSLTHALGERETAAA